MLMLSSIAWRHNDVKYASSSSKMLAVGGLISQNILTREKKKKKKKKKKWIFQIFDRGIACLQNQSHNFFL